MTQLKIQTVPSLRLFNPEDGEVYVDVPHLVWEKLSQRERHEALFHTAQLCSYLSRGLDD